MSDTQTNLNANSASKLELFLKYFPVAALSCVLIVILFIDFRPICEATRELAARAKTVAVLKGFGVELDYENPADKTMVHVTRHRVSREPLTKGEFDRK